MRPYRGITKEGKLVKGWPFHADDGRIAMITAVVSDDEEVRPFAFVEVIPETVGQQTGCQDVYQGDKVVMDCWNGGDGISEPDHHDIFEGVVVYDQKICRWGLQTDKCDDGQIEVGLEDSRYTTIEIIGNIHEESK